MSTNYLKLTLWLAAFFLLASGAYLRLFPIATQPYWMDEGYTINAVLSYEAGNTSGLAATLDSGQSYECFMYCYPTALITKYFGDTAFNYRILAVIFGLLTVVVIFAVTRSLYTFPIALLSGFLILFSYFHIAWSTQARWYTMLTCLFWLTIFLAWRTNQQLSRPRSYYLHLALTTTLCLLTVLVHKIAIILPVLVVAILTYPYLSSRALKPSKRTLTYLALLVLTLVGTAYVIANGLINSFFSSLSLHYTLPYYLSFLIREYWVLLPFIFFAVAEGGRRTQFLLLVFLSYLIPLSFFTNIVHYRYLFHVTPALFILTAVGLFAIAKSLPGPLYIKQGAAVTVFIILFFASGTGSYLPRAHYFLEADDPAEAPTMLAARPSYAYTPQPDWNAAYAFIKSAGVQGDSIISSHPHFNKIFLNEPGYWLSYSYLGLDDRTEYRTADNREFYVGASIIDDIPTLERLITTTHGFIIFDYMAQDGRITQDTLDFIAARTTLVYFHELNSYSKIWVYQF